MLNRRLIVLGVGVLLIAAAIASAQTPRPPFAVLVDQVVALFPKVAGEVIEVQGRQLTLGLGQRDGMQPGVDLSLYREGAELRHPKTREMLGRREESLGKVTVSQVFEGYSVATLPPPAEARVGDKVRLSAGKIKLTLMPLVAEMRDAQVEATVQELTEELNRSGRFQVVMGDALAVQLGQDGIKPEEAIEGKGLAAAAKRFGVDHVLAVLLRRVQNKPYIDVRLFGSDLTKPPLVKTALFVPPSVKPRPSGQFSANARSGPERPAKQQSLLARILGWSDETGVYSSAENNLPLREIAKFDYPVVAMDVALGPKDRVPRMVVSDGQKVYQFRIVDLKLVPEWTFGARSFGTVVSLQFADLDGDGRLKVVANRWDPKGGLNSFIVTADDGKAKYLADSIDSILFAVDTKGDGVKQTLWAQRFSPEKFFTTGQAEQVAVKKGKLVVERPVAVPAEFRATGAVFSNISGKDSRALVYVDEYNRLRITSDQGELWRSSTPVGGGYAVVELLRRLGQYDRSYFFRMEPTPLALDLDGDGIEEIVIPQNKVREGLLAVIFKGPAGFRLQTVDTGFGGAITALGTFKTEDASQPTIVASVVRFGDFLKTSGETQIIMTVPE